MAHIRPLPPSSRHSSANPADDHNALPSLNELFPEALFRGSLPQPTSSSSSFKPLALSPRSHPARDLPARSSIQDHTPPPTSVIPCTSACCHPPASAQIPHAPLKPLPPRGWSQPALPGPSNPPFHTAAAATANASNLLSPADELVSAVTSARQPAFFSPYAAIALPDARTRPSHRQPEQARHPAPLPAPATYHGQPVPSSSNTRGKTRYADPTPADVQQPSARAKPISAPADDTERRHCCPHCNKRFNRPSSLAIHVNTHTGAKPFTCAFPGCNRKFNVNSNMRRHYRNHLTTRRRDVVARMVQSPPHSEPVPRARPSQMSPYSLPALNRAQEQHQPQHQQPIHLPAGVRAGSTPGSMSGYGSGSRSPSRSPSFSPIPSPSPSPLPSPVSAVTSPFPPTPRSLPATSFRTVSPSRPAYSQHQPHAYPHAYTLPHHHSHLHHLHHQQEPLPFALLGEKDQEREHHHHQRERTSPEWPHADDFDDDADADADAGALHAHTHTHTHAHAAAAAAESFVRGERSRSRESERNQDMEMVRRPRAESSPESRRPRPYPSPRARPHRLSTASAPDAEATLQVQVEREARKSLGGACDVPGCTDCHGAVGRTGMGMGTGMGTPRLRPAFQEMHAGWTVLEDDSEDGN